MPKKSKDAKNNTKSASTIKVSGGGVKKPLNAYFTKMLAAKQNGDTKFVHNGKTYVRAQTARGLTVYKREP